MPAFAAVALLAVARPRPREIDAIRRLPAAAMVFCTVGDGFALCRLIGDPRPMTMGAVAVLTYLVIQAMVSAGPLGRGARWTWTAASAVFGIAGASFTAMGVVWFSSQPLVLPAGIVWTGRYFAAISLLFTQRVRDRILA